MQSAFTFPARHGGARKNAGRKKGKGRSNVAHRARASVRRDCPVHVTLRVSRAVGNLRTKCRFQPIKRALREGADRFGCRLVHFSVQKNHLHLLVEPVDRRALMRAMKGLQVRIARRLNVAIGRSGQVFADRYHAHVLTTPREVRHAIAYVLLNARKHARQAGRSLPERWIDPYSSARWFDGFQNLHPRTMGEPRTGDPHIGDPRIGEPRIGGPPEKWLLRVGWRRRGLIRVDEVPGPLR